MTNLHTFCFTKASINRAIPAEIFEFTPPPDATELQHGFTGGGGGGIRSATDGVQTWHSTGRDGGTVVERSEITVDGVKVNFVRRLTLADDRRHMRVFETIDGPGGRTEREYTIDLGAGNDPA
jgi:hypothetical protein